ncbi:helix-turn-helix transcriptional regulator [Roseivirga sp.]|uniref:helix-turn-helix transcriptional regulator n=1 Tax=Roseivirga sp. TaxID=1964215 RepID=UPI003B8B0313
MKYISPGKKTSKKPAKYTMTIQERNMVNNLVLELHGTHAKLRQRLSFRYPVLTEYDLRLCIMLKANIPTKDISLLLNITPDSVKKAKHRLRRKLRMNPKVSWMVFLDNID